MLLQQSMVRSLSIPAPKSFACQKTQQIIQIQNSTALSKLSTWLAQVPRNAYKDYGTKPIGMSGASLEGWLK